MNSKRYFGIVGAVLLAIGLWSLPAHAQPGPGWHRPGGMMGQGPGVMLPLLLKGVTLTADQKAQVQQIMANHRATFHDLFNQLQTAQQDMSNKLFGPGSLQESDLTSQSQLVSQLRNQLAQEGLKVMLEIRGVLTPDQLAKAAEIKQQMQALRSQMRSLFGPTQ